MVGGLAVGAGWLCGFGQMGTSFRYAGLDSHCAIEVAGFYPERQRFGVGPGLLVEEGRDAESIGEMKLGQGVLDAIDLDGFEDDGLGFGGAAHAAEDVGDVAEGVGQVHGVVEFAIEAGGGAVVAGCRLVVAEIAGDAAKFYVDGGAKRLSVGGLPVFEGVAEELTSVPALPFPQGFAATVE